MDAASVVTEPRWDEPGSERSQCGQRLAPESGQPPDRRLSMKDEAGREVAPMRSVPAMARAGSERRIGAVHLQSHQRIPAPRLIAVIASSAIAVVKRVSFAFT